jgi:hypothetical protein
MQRTKFGFSHDSSFWRLQFSGLVQVWFAIESALRIRAAFDAVNGQNSSYP